MFLENDIKETVPDSLNTSKSDVQTVMPKYADDQVTAAVVTASKEASAV